MNSNYNPNQCSSQQNQLDFSIIDRQAQRNGKFDFTLECLLTDRDQQPKSSSKNKNTINSEAALQNIDSIVQQKQHIQNGSFLKDLAKFEQQVSFEKSVYDVYAQNNQSKEENQYTIQMEIVKPDFKKTKHQFQDSAQATTSVSAMESKFTNLEITKKIHKIITKQKKNPAIPFTHLIIDFKDKNLNKKHKKCQHEKMKTCEKNNKKLSSLVLQTKEQIINKNKQKSESIKKTKGGFHSPSLQKIRLSSQASPRSSINMRHSYQNIYSTKNLYQTSSKLKKSKSKQQLTKTSIGSQQILFDTRKQYFVQTPKPHNYFQKNIEKFSKLTKSKKSLTNINWDKLPSPNFELLNAISEKKIVTEKNHNQKSRKKLLTNKIEKKTGIFAFKPVR